MAWSEQAQLTERFASVRQFLRSECRHWQLGASYEGWVAAQHREAPRWMSLVKQRLRMLGAALAPSRFGRWRAVAVDGTLVACPRTMANQTAMGERGKPEGIPQAALTAIVDLNTNLPWDFRVGPGLESERAHLREMLDDLLADALLVADAGFIGYELCREMLAKQRPFLFRVGGNIHLLRELGYEMDVRKEIVYLWPAAQQYKNSPSIRLRLIVIHDERKQPVYLVTNVLDCAELSDKLAAEIYRARWGVEVEYRTLKQTLEHHTLHSRTPETCYLELAWYVFGMWLLQLLTAREVRAAGGDTRRISSAGARNCVRRAMRNHRPRASSRCTLREALGSSVVDAYQRRGNKASRGYPRQKRHQPPNPPIIKPPTALQLRKAQQLTPLELRE